MNFIAKIKSLFATQDKYDEEVSRLGKYTNYKEDEAKESKPGLHDADKKTKASKQIVQNDRADKFAKDIKQTFSQNLMGGKELQRHDHKTNEDVNDFLFK